MNDGAGGAIAVLIVLVIFILVGREIVCWYLKINKRVELLESILEEVKKRQ